MKLKNELTIDAPLEQAWPLLLDVPRVANALPGAQVEEGSDGTYNGTMKVKVGPMTMNYKGTVAMEEVDEDDHTARMRAQARETRGQGTASATITNRLSEAESGQTRLEVETDLSITGRAAQFGRGMMEEIAGRMLAEFAQGLERELSGGNEAAASTEGASAEATSAAATGRSGQGAATETTAAEAPSGEGAAQAADAAEAPASSGEGEALDLGGAILPSLRDRGAVIGVGVVIGLILGRLIWRR